MQYQAFAAFVPLDEENTIIYLRYYQKLVKIPLLKWIINHLGKISGIIMLRQDKKAVIMQLPKKAGLQIDEHLTMDDIPIMNIGNIVRC